ncbi:VanZ family protein [Streptococcus merionis]|nr:VanZ family protein [Streptococcus merionis]
MQILQRSLCGYIFVIPILFLYFIFLKKNGKEQTVVHIIFSFIFCYYLIGILTVTGIGKSLGFSPKFELIPFKGMISAPTDAILNIILFIPLGFFLPILYRNFNHIKKIVLVALSVSLSVELFQMFGRGATDINDLITNTVGACIGYTVYKILFKFMKQELKSSFFSIGINEYLEVFFYWVCLFILMITIQPFIIYWLFNLG